ncbi:FmdB family zinc ribbon protein [Nocardia spumae]|uniref:FmdB family zinc ribbon protein n=2 Tax=Nocardia spumae TaxID=2887190 RepID=UPI001D145C47|nr:zinc ribbon domain-containing protein [Nocardia spumae]
MLTPRPQVPELGHNSSMPTYAYRCRECTESFELTRPMSESGDPAICPGGHRDTVKLLTTVAITGSAAPAAPAAPAAGGGCCGGGCCG